MTLDALVIPWYYKTNEPAPSCIENFLLGNADPDSDRVLVFGKQN